MKGIRVSLIISVSDCVGAVKIVPSVVHVSRKIIPFEIARPCLGGSAQNHMKVAVVRIDSFVSHAAPVRLIKTETSVYHHPFQAACPAAAQVHF